MLLTEYSNFSSIVDKANLPYPRYLLEDEVSVGYEDITNIENVDAFAFNIGYDYKVVRDFIKTLVEEKGVENLTSNEIVIAVKHKIGAFEFRLAAAGGSLDSLVSLGLVYHSKVVAIRMERLYKFVVLVNNYLTGTDGGALVSELVVNAINTDNLILKYLHFGIEGKFAGNSVEGLFDLINATEGTSFELTGFRGKSWEVNDATTISQFCDRLLNVLQNNGD